MRRFGQLRQSKQFHPFRKFRSIRSLYRASLCLALTAFLCFCALPLRPAAAEDDIRALFINVQKADAALLLLGEERYLVDTGAKSSYSALEKALFLYGVDRLDGVIITHLHSDHVGGLKKLLKSGVRVDGLYAGIFSSDAYQGEDTVERLAADYGIPLTRLAAGDSLTMGGCALHVLGPLARDAESENNNSLVLNLETTQGNFLLAGDMELEEEAELLDKNLIPQATVLKVAHHGEDDATSKRLVLQVKPQWAVISTSTAEEPDTPDNKVVSRLWDVKAGVAVTQNGEVGILVTLRDGRATAEQIDFK